MKNVKELFERLTKGGDFSQRYPQLNQEDGKVHVLYVGPCLNATGYYRMIAPALELNESPTHRAIVSGIHKHDFSKGFEDYDNPLDKRLLKWAHYIILPAMLNDARWSTGLIREVNPDAVLVMDLDFNYHALPPMHKGYGGLQQMQKDQLLQNIARMDMLTTASEGMSWYYEDLLAKHYPHSGTVRVSTQPCIQNRVRGNWCSNQERFGPLADWHCGQCGRCL